MRNYTFLAKSFFISLVLCIVIGALSAGCAQETSTPTKPAQTTQPVQQTGPTYGGILRVSLTSDGASIGYPAKLTGVAGNRQAAPAIETLFRTDKEGKEIPWLATGYTSDVTAKTITITLQKNVKFHDGTDFDAEAVKWNLEQCKAVKMAGTDKFASIDAIDASTVRISLTEWDNTVVGNLTQTMGMMISPTACKKNGADWSANNPVGTGPFQFVSWVKAAKTTYKKFDGYWQKGKPYLDGVEYIPIVDAVTQEMALINNEVDLLSNPGGRDLSRARAAGLNITLANSGAGIWAIVFDSGEPKSPFADLKVRQAVTHAIDCDAIVKGVTYGMGTVTNQFVYKGNWGYNPSVIGYPYDPNKAKQLLAEAGYPNGFKTKLTYVSPQYNLLFTAAQGFLKAVGIDAQQDPVNITKYWQISWGGEPWEGMVQSTFGGNPDLAAWLNARYNGAPCVIKMLLPADYRQAIKNAVTAPDFATKQKWTQETQKLMIDKYCLLSPLYASLDSAISGKKVHNHGFLANPNTAFWTPEETWIEK